MAAAKSHPTGADLEAFALGTLNNLSLPAVEAHVADCPTCQEQAASVAGDPLVELLRRAHTRAPGQVDTMAEAAAQSPTPPPGQWVNLEAALSRQDPLLGAAARALPRRNGLLLKSAPP